MASLIFNQTYRIKSGTFAGIWRVVCSLPEKEESVLVRLPIDTDKLANGEIKVDVKKTCIQPKRMPFSLSSYLLETGDMEVVTINFDAQTVDIDRQQSKAEHDTFKLRSAVMDVFFSPTNLARNFESDGKFGGLVAVAKLIKRSDIPVEVSSRTADDRPAATVPAIYSWLKLLCVYGFNVASLRTRYSNCGAPGKAREYKTPSSKPGIKTLPEKMNTETNPQRSVRLSERDQILMKMVAFLKKSKGFSDAYEKLVLELWVTTWDWNGSKFNAVMPERGTYPTESQVRYLFETYVSKMMRLEKGMTSKTFARSHRGLSGYARDGVAGPGHMSAIDSTRSDTELRSSVNRHWLIGRPFVYWIVDVWSTAITGFYVCLGHPSWANARIAIFCSVFDVSELDSAWGVPMDIGLHPRPTISASYLADRGEYLSEGALDTAKKLAFDLSINDSYRADLKGLVEVMNRIQKDDAYGMIPGTVDARRVAYENRKNPKLSSMTLREFVGYLRDFVEHRNLTADCKHLCTDEMLALGIDPTPAGLWKYGHDIGIGFQSSNSNENLIRELLSPLDMTVNRSGLEHGGLRYLSEEIDITKWSGEARNFGAFPVNGFHIPSAPQKIWAALPSDKQRQFTLAPNSAMSAESSLLEHCDAQAFELAKRSVREHNELSAKVSYIYDNMQKAQAARKALEHEPLPPFPLSIPEARAIDTPVALTQECNSACKALGTEKSSKKLEESSASSGFISVVEDLLDQIISDRAHA